MAGNLKDDIVKFIVDIQSSGNQKKLIDDLKSIEQQSATLRKEQDDLRKAMAFLETTGRKSSDTYEKLYLVFKENESQLKKNAAASKALQGGLDKTYMSSNQLVAKSKELQKALSGMSKAANPDEYARLENELSEVNGELGKLRNGAKQTSESFIGSKLSVEGLKASAMELLPAFGIAAIVGGIGMAAKSLFDLKKTMDGEGRRAAIVFGDSLKYVEGQATNLAEKMGLTNREFVAAAAGTADLLVPLGFSRQQSAEMAVQMTNLSGALDEWTAGKFGAVDISSRLTRAVLGECDSLKELGIGIRLDSQEYKNLVKQKKDAGAATDAQAQALAIMSMIMQKSTDAQTSYAGSGNEVLRTQKSMESGWRSLKEGIVDYLTLSASERLMKEAESVKAQGDAIEKNGKHIEDLLTRYEKLASQTNLSKVEQADLNKVIKELGAFAPSAISQLDDYGNAMGISAGKVREAVEAQRLLNLEMNKDVVKKMSGKLQDSLSDATDYKEEADKQLKIQQRKENTTWGKGVKFVLNSVVGISDKEIKKNGEEALVKYQGKLAAANTEAAKFILQLQARGKTMSEIADEAGVSWKTLDGIVKNYMGGVSNTSTDVVVPPTPPKETKKKDYSLNNDKDYQSASLKLKEDYYKGVIKTEEEYSKKSLELEISTLQSKLDKGKLSKDERLKIENDLMDKRISLLKTLKKEDEKEDDERKKKDEKHAEGLSKLNDVAQKYGIKATEDKIAQLNAQEMADIAALDKELANTEEYERAKSTIHDYYNQQRKEENLKRDQQNQLDHLNALAINATTLDGEYQAKVDLENLQFEQDKLRLEQQHLSTESLEAQHKQRLLALEQNYTQQKMAVAQSVMGATSNMLGALGNLYSAQKAKELKAAGNDEKKKEEIMRKYAKKEQMIAVGQALISGSMAVMQIWAGKITGNPLIDTIIKGALTAAQVVTTGIQLSAIKQQQFREGGYTAGSPSDNDPVGVVHANEFVATADAKRNPTIKPILDVLDKAQQNKTIRTLDMRQVLGSGFRSGGYTAGSPANVTVNQDMGTIREAAEVNKQLLAMLRKGIKANVSMLGEAGLVEAEKEYADWENNRNF